MEDRKLRKEREKAEKAEKFKNKNNIFSNSNKKVNLKLLPETKIDIKTPFGCKKDVLRDLPKTYCPIYTEEGWFDWWESQGYFKPEYNEKKSDEKFVMMIPPPNVTGILHIGHALTCSIEDCIVRWNRMKGKQTLWLPGTDHAGIATQTVIEKKLLREKKLTRHDIGREAFIQEIWKWKEEKGDYIINQLKQLGASCDFSRLKFTMQDSMSLAVTEAFVRLFEEKMIYRSKRLVNWSCSLRSAISDIEVDKVEISKRTFLNVPNYTKPIEFGYLVHFAYEVVNTKEKIYVATTRIETMLGDTGLAVHPDDSRYTHLHGQFVSHPFIPFRIIPIVCDTFVNKDFGTGAVKITPAHDHNDYEVGKRHNLEFINILSDDGLILEGFGEFSGMKRFDARKAIIESLDKLGLYEKTTDNPMVIPVCSKSKDIIEPMIKNQWYLRCQEMAKEALRVVQEGELRLVPDGVHNITWTRWMEDCHDWCISRQLWWGHQIPVYKVSIRNRPELPDENDNWVAARNKEDAILTAAAKFNESPENINVLQDPDVLDTWFSSQLFPFSTLGWPNTTEDLTKFYPGNLLETGHDIIFFWVSRMVMIGLKLMGRLPFNTVYLHAMIRDAHGKKMSKSLGNVLDPHDIIHGISLVSLQNSLEQGNLDPKELTRARASQAKDFPDGIPQCGTDALRFALLAYTTQPRDINLDVLRVRGYRNFCNKIWQAFKFAQLFGISDVFVPNELLTLADTLSPIDRWILSRLAVAVNDVNEALSNYCFATATTAIYRFWLYELCDVYIEYAKQFRNRDSDNCGRQALICQVLYRCLHTGLRLLHPMMPFITEELFQRLLRIDPTTSDREHSIMVSPFPESADYSTLRDLQLETRVDMANEICRRIRSYRKERGLPDKKALVVCVLVKDPEFCRDFLDELILPLSNCTRQPVYKSSSLEIFTNDYITIYEELCRDNLSITVSEEQDHYFHFRVTRDQRISALQKFSTVLGACSKESEPMEYVLVRQWCGWIDVQSAKGTAGLSTALEFLERHLYLNTFITGLRSPTIADSLVLQYINGHSVCDNNYPNIKRWRQSVMDYN